MASGRQLTGLLKFQLTKEWMKRGCPDTREEFIKKACEALGITYVEPKKDKKDV